MVETSDGWRCAFLLWRFLRVFLKPSLIHMPTGVMVIWISLTHNFTICLSQLGFGPFVLVQQHARSWAWRRPSTRYKYCTWMRRKMYVCITNLARLWLMEQRGMRMYLCASSIWWSGGCVHPRLEVSKMDPGSGLVFEKKALRSLFRIIRVV